MIRDEVLTAEEVEGKSNTELLSKHILELQKDKGNLTDRVQELEAQIEKMKNCGNCKNYSPTYGLCCYSLGDEDYDCRLRKWEIKEK